MSRALTLSEPAWVPPWVVLPPGTPAVAEYYEREGLWPAQSIARRQALLPRIQAYRAAARLDPA